MAHPRSTHPRCSELHPGLTRPTLLDAGLLPVAEIARLSDREGWRPRPIYQAHRWFARRFGSAFRSLLVAAALPEDGDFWKAYYAGVDYQGRTVLDPFVGGGTSVIESLRLGANVVGVDVDAVACAITRFETRAAATPDLIPFLEALKQQVGKRLARYYRTVTPEGEEREVLHYFWVQVVRCRGCSARVEAHPHHQLAYEAEGTKQWVFCPKCGEIHERKRDETVLRCRACKSFSHIEKGNAERGLLTCPSCKTTERLIEVASRTGSPPDWHLFAMEVLEPGGSRRTIPLSQRRFVRATDQDRHLYDLARQALRRHAKKTGSAWIPDQIIPREGRSDNRLIDYGYARYCDLFNARQLLHLSCLAEAIDGVVGLAREALSLAFSDHLTTTCMMTYYAFGWRRLSPLFALRAFRHVTRPVEINPWLDGTGRGTFPNTVRQVQRAATFARSPNEPMLAGGFVATPAFPHVAGTDQARILHSSSAKISELKDDSIDFVLTDPPYFDNIAYSELSDFYRPWLHLLGITPGGEKARLGLRKNLAAKGRGEDSQEPFEKLLSACFTEVSRVLKPNGRFVFTFQHQCGRAWEALGASLNEAGLQPIQVIPMLGNSRAGLHVHDGTALWDAVVVARPSEQKNDVPLRLGSGALEAAKVHCTRWSDPLSQDKKANFGPADRSNLMRACLTAAALGAFGAVERVSDMRFLHEVLEEV